MDLVCYRNLVFLLLCVSGFFVSMFGITYLISPRFCHRMVGYLEEEAVKTYTKCIEVSLDLFTVMQR